MNAHQLFHAGKLQEALDCVVEEVRNNPTDVGRRLFLSELLCFTGDLERADKQLDAVSHADAKTLPMVLGLRQLVRAEQARRDHFKEGRVPEFVAPPEGAERLLLEASVLVRGGAMAEAAEVLERVEAERARPAGTCNGAEFTDFRDLDDRTSCVLEVYTSSGKYYWVPIAAVESLEFHAPAEPRDLLWRRALMSVHGGPEGEVFLPVLYCGSDAQADEALKLGRSTDWRDDPSGRAEGVGQRMFLVGSEAVPILELKSVTFKPRAAE